MLGDTVISAYERFPLAVYGDGIQTVQQLLVTTQQTLPLRGRPSSQIIPHDPRIDIKLADLGLLGLRLAGVDIICRDLCTDAGT
ncbi:hypothetical protein DZA65_01995 [Dickeya dianthicola]|uniref:hypothetical protein n=1 Tax=Dickeya dianthicola TaxID=204039 RepID=UPI0003A78450|nr:hypothetical protein [Dickeya dianthicola]ATO32933.1 hypothetical protein DDI_1765 [Dickeya dianthicola RNS04.9]AYC18885.1 hypothetical protein DZA65_01995 [Dickeya dianthicola]MCA7004915.1 hypothetical protein [Dickeya dianthicola]MCI4032667.1 hypothetical protein [Dickeya dianthicola]MCI4152463.1 hypothetical protein [Dickeya dianthicola]